MGKVKSKMKVLKSISRNYRKRLRLEVPGNAARHPQSGLSSRVFETAMALSI